MIDPFFHDFRHFKVQKGSSTVLLNIIFFILRTLVHLGDDGSADFFQFLLLVFELVLFGSLVGVEPLDRLVALVRDRLHLVGRDLVLHLVILHRLLHLESIRLQIVLKPSLKRMSLTIFFFGPSRAVLRTSRKKSLDCFPETQKFRKTIEDLFTRGSQD